MRTFYFWKWNGSNKTEAIPISVAVVHGTKTLAYICIYCGIHVVFTINWYTLKFIFDKVLMNQITEIFEVTFVPCDLRIDLFSSKAHDNRKNSPHIHQFACTHTHARIFWLHLFVWCVYYYDIVVWLLHIDHLCTEYQISNRTTTRTTTKTTKKYA